MTAVAGSLYLDAPLRVCNAHRMDEQDHVGVALIGVAATVAVIWLVLAGCMLVREK